MYEMKVLKEWADLYYDSQNNHSIACISVSYYIFWLEITESKCTKWPIWLFKRSTVHLNGFDSSLPSELDDLIVKLLALLLYKWINIYSKL